MNRTEFVLLVARFWSQLAIPVDPTLEAKIKKHLQFILQYLEDSGSSNFFSKEEEFAIISRVCAIAKSISEAVSYTHLDVYKRQVYSITVILDINGNIHHM